MKKKDAFVLIFCILLAAVALICAVNLIIAILFSASDAGGLAHFFNEIAAYALSAVCTLNALCSLILCAVMINNHMNRILTITVICIDLSCLAVVLGTLLIFR